MPSTGVILNHPVTRFFNITLRIIHTSERVNILDKQNFMFTISWIGYTSKRESKGFERYN